MKKYIFLSLLSALVTAFVACGSDDNDKDMTAPVISGRGLTASPINCQVYHPGDVISFRYLFEDDTELGSFNIEVHGNFDHHSHSTEADDHDHEGSECHHDDDHEAETSGTPWVFNQDYGRHPRWPGFLQGCGGDTHPCRCPSWRLSLHDSPHRPCRLAAAQSRCHPD